MRVKGKVEQDAKAEFDAIFGKASAALEMKVQENEHLLRENERVKGEAAAVIQRKDKETLALKNHAEAALHHASQDNQAIQQRKIDFEVADNRNKEVIAATDRDWLKSNEDMRMQLQADFQKQNEATVRYCNLKLCWKYKNVKQI